MLKLSGVSNVFKRDIKRIKSQGKKFELLDEIIILLLEEKKLPAKYCNHKLIGNYQGYWELHIKPDWLLIYKIIGDSLYLARTGSHAELF